MLRQAILAKSNIKDTTRASYLALLKPVLDCSLDDPDVMDWANNIPNPNVKRSAIIALRAAGYEYKGVKPKTPKAYPRRYDLPDEEELLLLFSYTKKYRVQYLCMMYLGLRLGEACIVNKSHLLPGPRLYVTQQVAEWRDENGKRKTEIREPKSTPAVIDIPQWLADELPDKPNPLVPSNVRAALHWASNKYLGKTVNPHQLRHWNITTMIERGVPMPIVQRQARHSFIQTTMVYADLHNRRMTLFDEPV